MSYPRTLEEYEVEYTGLLEENERLRAENDGLRLHLSPPYEKPAVTLLFDLNEERN